MPFSQSTQLSSIVGFIEELAPTSILDVGIGMGQYGFLARTNLEGEHLFVVDGLNGWQRPKSEWQVRIDGIEGCAAYLTPVHEYAYNKVMIGNALDLLPSIPADTYDLVLAIDILEHLEKGEGYRFLAEIKRIARHFALVSTPKEFMPQEIPANPYENHRSLWLADDLIQAGYSRIIDNSQSWITVHEKLARIE